MTDSPDDPSVDSPEDPSTTERQTELRLTGLAEASSDLLAAEDRESVSRIVIATIDGVLGHELACVRLYDRDANELVRTALTDRAAELVQSEVAYDLQSSNAGAAYRTGETVRREQSNEKTTDDPCRAAIHVPLGEFGVLSVFDRNDSLSDRDVRLIELFAGIVRSAFTRTEREERLRSQRAELERSRDELSAVAEFNALVTEVIRSILRATSGEAVKQAVCDGLCESDLYDAAWIATVDGDTDEVAIETQSVATGSFVESDALAFVRSSFARQLVRKASDRDSSVVERRRFESQSLDDEESIASAVPVACGRQRFGVLAVAGSEEGGFGETTRSGLELLGEALGFAIIADRRRSMLIESDAVELEFAFGGPTADLSAAFDCRCDHLGRAPEVDDGNAYDVRIGHDDFGEIREFLATYPAIEACDVVEERDRECVVRIRVERAPPKLLAEAGFSLTSMYAENGETRLIAEVPEDEDVVRVLEALREYWEDVRLVAKRQTPTRRPNVPFPDGNETELTDRQRSVLETAHEMGYYDWPRGHTAEEVAERLDIASSTLHQHLRVAERAVVSAFVSEE